jgi:hypothetical protein
LGGRGRQISEFEASLVYRSEFQDNQGCTEKSCLQKPKTKNQKKKIKVAQNLYANITIYPLKRKKERKKKYKVLKIKLRTGRD